MSKFFEKLEKEVFEGVVGHQRRSTLGNDQLALVREVPNICVSCGDPGKYSLCNPANGEPEIFCKECGAVTQALRRAAERDAKI